VITVLFPPGQFQSFFIQVVNCQQCLPLLEEVKVADYLELKLIGVPNDFKLLLFIFPVLVF